MSLITPFLQPLILLLWGQTLLAANEYKTGYVPNVTHQEFCQDTYKCKNILHTVCKYRCKIDEDNCRFYEAWELDNDRRQYILDMHNFYRNFVAAGNESRGGGLPPAANMRSLNYELMHEPITHCWMRRCKWGHDECRGIKGIRYVGQNAYFHTIYKDMPEMYADGYSTFNISIFNWYEEVKFMLKGDVANHRSTPYGPEQTGHATQLFWWKTRNIGCGLSRHEYQEETSLLAWFFFCNYGPNGNIVNKPIYLEGPPASQCPDKLKPDPEFKNLCGDVFHVSRNRKSFTQKVGAHEYTFTPKPTESIKKLPKLPSASGDKDPDTNKTKDSITDTDTDSDSDSDQETGFSSASKTFLTGHKLLGVGIVLHVTYT